MARLRGQPGGRKHNRQQRGKFTKPSTRRPEKMIKQCIQQLLKNNGLNKAVELCLKRANGVGGTELVLVIAAMINEDPEQHKQNITRLAEQGINNHHFTDVQCIHLARLFNQHNGLRKLSYEVLVA